VQPSGVQRNLSTFEYDGDGNRISKNSIHGRSIKSNEYLLDINGVFPQVLTEFDENGTTYYTYGMDLISMTDPKRGEFYYHHDGLGSVRSLSDNKESIKAIYFYDAFGQLQKKMGYVDNDFLFSGEQMDTETGLIYLRARYYDPSVGRFLTKDPMVGNGYVPSTLNRYVSVENNPVNFIDPLGLIKEDRLSSQNEGWVSKKLDWLWTHSYVDIGVSGFVPTHVMIGPGGQGGVVIVPSSGVFLYGGGGVGIGAGGSGTLNIGEPSEGFEGQFTVAVGYGPGAQFSLSNSGPSLGVGLGLEASGSLTLNYYKKIINW